MLFTEGKSALVRLSDCIKVSLDECQSVSHRVIEAHREHGPALAALRNLAAKAEKGVIDSGAFERQALDLARAIPMEASYQVVAAQGKLHSFVLSTILSCCFCLESYINSFAFHIFQEKDFLGLVREGHDATAEILIDAIERMSTAAKWEAVGKLKKGSGFDQSKSPYQDFKHLFNFRNDLVHDKVVDYKKTDIARNRYGNRLPDPVFGMLELEHAIYAASTYWEMVGKIHQLTDYPSSEFQRHYGLDHHSGQGPVLGLVKVLRE
ncbi:hypothetical protein, partial [Candidatus Accumulibacter aalborgensis]|uniref:hypothetical protein n=1 Tax=Candidatus Accumulibacter aalborgensis TaxID=1860102 RepID=UPI0016479C8C